MQTLRWSGKPWVEKIFYRKVNFIQRTPQSLAYVRILLQPGFGNSDP